MRFIHRTALLLVSSLLVFLAQGTIFSVASAHTSAFLAGDVPQAASAACPQPPQNVDLMTLSDAQLQLYGLPPHQVLNQDPKEWSYLLAHAHHRDCGSTPDSHKHTQLPHPRQSGIINGTSPNWAGNVAYGSRGTYREAAVDFYIPTLAPVVNDSWVSIWAGVGGDGTQTSPAKVVQAGVVSTFYPTYQVNEGWWEVYPGYDEQIFLIDLHSGDHIHVYISSNLNNDGYDYFFVQDITQNYYNTHQDTTSQDFSDSATGECIVERPLDDSGQLDPLAEFNPPGHVEQISSCDIANSTGQYQPIGNWPHYSYTMVNGSKTLAYPGSITNGGLNFPVTWAASN